MKICKNCKWRGRLWLVFDHLQYCHHPKVIEDKYKTHAKDTAFADIARQHGPCGLEGRFYESR